MNSRSWLSPQEYPLETERAIHHLGNNAYELCFHGKVRTGKTRLALKRLIGLHFKYFGMTSGIVRKNNVDMNLSIRPDIRELARYSLYSEQSPIVARGGHDFNLLRINGGECRLIGLNNEDHILGTKYDLLFLSQLDQIRQADYEKLITRLSGTAIRDANGRPYRQILSDMNPSEPDSYIYEREAAGQMQIVDFDFIDNPHFYRGERWTEHGYYYVKDLRDRLTGLNYDRYYLGRRVSAQGGSLPVGWVSLHRSASRFVGLPQIHCDRLGLASSDRCFMVGLESRNKSRHRISGMENHRNRLHSHRSSDQPVQ